MEKFMFGLDRYRVWKTTDLEEAQRLVMDPFSGPTMSLIERIEETDNVLDFGCGIGRNTFALADCCKKVVAYDFPNMIDFLLADVRFKDYDNIHATSDWNKVKTQKFDAILCCLVLQHIHPNDLDVYLKDFVNMTDYLYVATRDYVDFDGGKILPYLEKHWIMVGMIADDSEHGHYQIKFGSSAEELDEKIDEEIDKHVRRILKKENK